MSPGEGLQTIESPYPSPQPSPHGRGGALPAGVDSEYRFGLKYVSFFKIKPILAVPARKRHIHGVDESARCETIHLLVALCLLAGLAPARAQNTAAPFDADLQRFAEILGTLHYLRGICGANDGPKWRNEMQALADAETPSGERRAKLIGGFNRGYQGFQQTLSDLYARGGRCHFVDISTKAPKSPATSRRVTPTDFRIHDHGHHHHPRHSSAKLGLGTSR